MAEVITSFVQGRQLHNFQMNPTLPDPIATNAYLYVKALIARHHGKILTIQ